MTSLFFDLPPEATAIYELHEKSSAESPAQLADFEEKRGDKVTPLPESLVAIVAPGWLMKCRPNKLHLLWPWPRTIGPITGPPTQCGGGSWK